ncbi:MAG: cytochrome P460 family protein, partial [Acetobacteraceae bacterium]
MEGKGSMKRASSRVFAAAMAACVIASMPFTAGGADDKSSPIYGVKIPAGYRDWELVAVAHEAGDLNDLRAVLGNASAMKAFRDGTRPFPDGTIIA